jgi:hypothetical protein
MADVDNAQDPLQEAVAFGLNVVDDAMQRAKRARENSRWHFNRVVVPLLYFSLTCATAGIFGGGVLSEHAAQGLWLSAIVVLPAAGLSLLRSCLYVGVADDILRKAKEHFEQKKDM